MQKSASAINKAKDGNSPSQCLIQSPLDGAPHTQCWTNYCIQIHIQNTLATILHVKLNIVSSCNIQILNDVHLSSHAHTHTHTQRSLLSVSPILLLLISYIDGDLHALLLYPAPSHPAPLPVREKIYSGALLQMATLNLQLPAFVCARRRRRCRRRSVGPQRASRKSMGGKVTELCLVGARCTRERLLSPGSMKCSVSQL